MPVKSWLEGDPGTGKTTLALKFLLEGAAQGEPVLYVTLSETKEELCCVAASHGWSLDQVNIYELIPDEESLKTESQYTVFHPSEVELGVIGATGRLITPGLLDPHEHLTGGSGEKGFSTRTPEIYLHEIIAAGITTVVGCLGVDTTTKTMAGLLASATRPTSVRSSSVFVPRIRTKRHPADVQDRASGG